MQTPARLLLHGVLRSLLRCPLLKSGPLKDKLLLLLLSRFSRVRLCDPLDGSPPDSPIPGILQARILEWAAISFSNACMHAKSLQLCLTLCDPMDKPTRLLCPQASLGKNTGVGCHFLLQIQSTVISKNWYNANKKINLNKLLSKSS